MPAQIITGRNPNTNQPSVASVIDGVVQTNTTLGGADISDASPLPSSIQRYSNTVTATIANGAAVSGAIDFRPYTMLVVEMPVAWTAARLAIRASHDGVTFLPLYDDMGNLVRFNGGAAVAVGTAYVAPPEIAGVRFIQLWSEDGAGGNANQDNNRFIVCHLKA